MYKALYRKYRPRSFSDVVGQEHITDTLKRQVSTDRISHAYLFVGSRGTGKTSCAKILARAINCLSPIDGDPCNTCASCQGIESGSILDVLELEAASNNRVENIRDLLDEAIYSPASVKKRVYIVDEVHMLSPAAFNALLQILEEPPKHLMFILATTELHKVPATILSRCQRFSFKRLSADLIASRLKYVAEQEGLTLTDEALEKLAALADGAMRDGLSLLDQCASDTNIDLARVLDTVGLSEQQELLRLADAIADRSAITSLEILDKLYDNGRDMAALLSELAVLMRDLLISKLSADSPLLSGGFGKTELLKLSDKISSERLFLNLEILRETSIGLLRGAAVKLSAEMCLIKLCDERLSDDVSALISRIERLEQQGPVAIDQKSSASTKTPEKQPPMEEIHEPDAALEISEELVPITETQEPEAAFETSEDLPSAAEAHESEDEIDPSEFVPEELDFEAAPLEDADPIAEVQTTAIEEDLAAESVQAAQEPESVDFWNNILNELKDDIAVHSLLSDSNEIDAKLQDSTLTVSAKNPFTVAQIESKLFSDALKEAAFKTLGRDIIIRTCAADDVIVESKRSKLEELANNFSIVNFE